MSTKRIRHPVGPAQREPQKCIVVVHLSTENWPPAGELDVALKNAVSCFVATLKGHLGEKLKGTVTVDVDANPPNPHLN
jgi:hypothetical protein